MEKIVIIGGGLGGLSVGALLAKEGYRVTLLEQHNIVGGCATVFKRKGGFTCEVGLHEMDGVYTNPTLRRVFEKLGVYEHVTFVKPKAFFRVVTQYGEFVMPDGIEAAKEALRIRFPQEKEAIEAYFLALERIEAFYEKLSALKWYHAPLFPLWLWKILPYKKRSVAEVLDSLTENEELKLILNANVHYYNDTPQSLSFLLHALAQISYYKGGGWYIRGGSYKLSEYLASVIESNGGAVITKANVIAANTNSVTYLHKKEQHTIQADRIISNIAPQSTYRLFGIETEESMALAESITTLYLGFSKNLREVYPDRNYSTFFLDRYASQNDFQTAMESDVTQRDFVFVDYARVDADLTPAEKSFGAVCIMNKIEAWEGLSKEAYKAKKNTVLESILSHLETHYPGITSLVEYAEVATPKTVKRYIKTPNGTAYGYKPTPAQFFRLPKVKSAKVKNLYFVGQFVLSGGFISAMLSAAMCYTAITKSRV